MKIWIDTQSGTWGAAETIVVVDLAEANGGNVEDNLALLDQGSDSEIQDFAQSWGSSLDELDTTFKS